MRLTQHDLTIAMWRVLVALSDNGAQRQVDLAGLTSIDVSTLSRLVSRLIAMGLVTRLRSAQSNREVVVRLTAQGETLVGAADPGRARAGETRDRRTAEGRARRGEGRAAADLCEFGRWGEAAVARALRSSPAAERGEAGGA